MSFSIDLEYKYIYKTDFSPNVFFLSKLYAPFLSKAAFCLYVFMCEELRNYNNTKFFKNKIKDILIILDIKEEDFEEIRNNLEAFELLKTYLNENDGKIYFELFEPLKFNKFIENKNYCANIEQKLGKYYLDKLIAQYELTLLNDLKNISVDSSIYFESKDLRKTPSFNFEKLYEKLSKTSKIHITISETVKNEIEFYFQKYKLSFLEIEKCVYDSLVKNNDGFEINLNLIQIQLEKLVDKSASDFKSILKINHANKLFIEKFSITDLNIVFKNYRNLKPEQFLTALTMEELKQTDIDIINMLRNKFLISDWLINIMIDFSIRKTHGELNSKYLSKMARSFNIENISSLNEAYDFLFNWDNKENVSKLSKKKNNQKKQIQKDNSYIESEKNIINSNLSDDEKTHEREDEVPIFEFEL